MESNFGANYHIIWASPQSQLQHCVLCVSEPVLPWICDRQFQTWVFWPDFTATGSAHCNCWQHDACCTICQGSHSAWELLWCYTCACVPMHHHCSVIKVIATNSYLILQQLPQLTGTADCRMQHMPSLTQCWKAVLILLLCMCAYAPAQQCNESICHKQFQCWPCFEATATTHYNCWLHDACCSICEGPHSAGKLFWFYSCACVPMHQHWSAM